jgi:hypothetical protein
VLDGHDHHYERTTKIRLDAAGAFVADATNGIRHFVVGMGGKEHYSFSRVPVRPELTDVRNATTFGVLKLELGESAVTWDFVTAAGEAPFSDSGRQSCR